MNQPTKIWRLLPLVAIAACSSLTKVDAPDIILPSNIANAAGARLLYAQAAGGMAYMYGLYSYTWDITDELTSGFGSPTDTRQFSTIVSNNSSNDVGYGYLH